MNAAELRLHAVVDRLVPTGRVGFADDSLMMILLGPLGTLRLVARYCGGILDVSRFEIDRLSLEADLCSGVVALQQAFCDEAGPAGLM